LILEIFILFGIKKDLMGFLLEISGNFTGTSDTSLHKNGFEGAAFNRTELDLVIDGQKCFRNVLYSQDGRMTATGTFNCLIV